MSYFLILGVVALGAASDRNCVLLTWTISFLNRASKQREKSPDIFLSKCWAFQSEVQGCESEHFERCCAETSLLRSCCGGSQGLRREHDLICPHWLSGGTCRQDGKFDQLCFFSKDNSISSVPPSLHPAALSNNPIRPRPLHNP